MPEHTATAGQEDLQLLDGTERARLGAFRRQADRDRFRASHIALRRLLGAYLGEADPAAVTIGRAPCRGCGGPHGRPVTKDGGPQFSLSHSGDLALIAVADTLVGTDVETVRDIGAVNAIAPELHPRERAELATLPHDDRPVALARCWTRKEAYCKGTGHGLAAGLDTVYVGTGPTPAPLPGWTLADVPVDAGHAAAVALATS
ncbi:4'-phosphopantetheinyl transferase superfamily protein [Streptomyces sp. NBC_01142]|uniref:4'-phosphopantetheinyl transferase family protein n=1 Tax=Streptomyces sp. NBC_01142 TaxID=2975865 RepID=UPI002256105D|nr:4'-phosphopantetheinyl transferase superfamily protein [Streptomyces sp. NBC_01142]MCX4827000.1 4'-phosphopantetheinyl transferase superfamily protein [Streptomyces sp. NBC_01142]